MKRLLLACFFLALIPALARAQEGTRMLHEPDISAERIVFVYAGDLWTAPATGGEARRLTAHPGTESSPKFSPDGRWIAFAGEYDGNTDVYVIPAEGGSPRRLTFHPGGDNVQGWTPDGSRVLFASNRFQPNRQSQLFTVSVEGGYPEQLPIPRAYLASYSPDGGAIAYTPMGNAFGTWKRYRGGRTTPTWIINLQDWTHVEVPHVNASDTYPVWIGDTVYFLSDRNLDMNIFAYDTNTGDLREVEGKEAYDIKYLSAGAGKLIFAREGYLYTYDPASGRTDQVVVDVNADNVNIRPHIKNVSTEIGNFHISPTGARAVFEAHGEILTVPAEKGDVRNLTRTPGVMERYPAWSPDGRYVAYFSDESGEYAVHIRDQLGREEPIRVPVPDPTFFYSPSWSPDSDKIVFTDKPGTIWVLDVESRNLTRVDELSSNPAWSPDGKWIAYQHSRVNRFGVVWAYSLEDGSRHQITDGMSDAAEPVFDADGKYLFFRASTNSGMSKSGLDMTSNDHPVTYEIYITVLRSDLPSPFSPQSDEEEVRRSDEGGAQGGRAEREQGQAEEDETPFRIDFDGLDQRVIALPVGDGPYSGLASVKGGALFYRSGSSLMKYDFDAREESTFLSGVTAFDVSADGKHLLYRAGRNWGIVGTTGKPSASDGRLDLAELDIDVDPLAEWAQMFREAWRLNRDYFYDPGMHGVDWEANYRKWEGYLPDLAHRSDLNYLLSEMLGELTVGHSYVRGGAFPEVDRVPGGLLGADFQVENGRYRLAKIYSGLNWNPDLRAPLTEPGVEVSEGDYILAVDGREVRGEDNIFAFFENTSGKQVVLTVNAEPGLSGARQVTVVPIGSESSLRNRDWVEENRRKVDELTDGRIGYVYLPNTGTGGYEYFNRYFFSQQDKEGFVIDERFNGGGQVANYIVEYLGKDLLNYWAPRTGPDYTSPFAASFGPKVMIINENAGSGGDWMPFFFRETGVGPLVGKRTWGGLVGIGGTPGLMDGGSVTAPNFGIFSKDGEWIIENEGVAPDYDVEMTPKAVIEGGDPQLERAVEVVLERVTTEGYTKTPRPRFPDKARGGGR
jgi:tricorn protease